MTLPSIVLYSNPITATVMLSATTIQIPIVIISSAKKYLAQAKDFVLNTIPAAQLFLFAAIAYHVFDKTPKISHYVFDKQVATKTAEEAIQVNSEDKEEQKQHNLNDLKIHMRYDEQAREALAKVNEEGQNLLGQAAKEGNIEAVNVMLSGSHDGVVATVADIAQHPVLNGADVLVNGSKAVLNKISPKLGEMLPNRTINSGATAEEINHPDNNGQNLLHIIADNAEKASDLNPAAKAVKKGGDLGKQDTKGNTPVVTALENKVLTEAVKKAKIVKVLTDNGKKLTEAVTPIVNNSDKSALITSVVEFAEQKNGYIFGRDNAEKLLAGTLTNAVKAKNTEVVKALIPTVNNLATTSQIKYAMQELTEDIKVREEAIANPCNQNPLKIAATGARDSGIKLSDVKNYMENKTVPASHKALSAVALVPHVPAMINDAIVSEAVSATSKVAGWMSDFLAAVGEELGKGITLDNSDFATDTQADYAAISQNTQGQSYGDYTTSLDQLLIGEANGQLFLECAKE